MCMLCWGKGGETAIASIYFTLFDRTHEPNPIAEAKNFFEARFFRETAFCHPRCAPLSAAVQCITSWGPDLKKKKKSKSFLNPGCEAGSAALKIAKVWKKNSNSKISHKAHPAVQDLILLSIVQSVLGPGTAAAAAEETCIHPPFHVGFSERERPHNTSALDEINRLNDNFRLSPRAGRHFRRFHPIGIFAPQTK